MAESLSNISDNSQTLRPERDVSSLSAASRTFSTPGSSKNSLKRTRAMEVSQEPTPKKQKMSHYPDMIDIVDDPKGDMVIQVGNNEDVGLVRVHKSVLMMTSPVFKAMFGGEFLEASCKFDENQPKVLDDDRTAFIDFCMLIHNQSRGEKQIPLARAPGVAVMCDKYCCPSILQTMSSELREYFGRDLQDVHAAELKAVGLRVEDAMCISYVAGDSKLFSRCTRFIISRTAKDRSMKHFKTEKSLLDLLPETLVDEFQTMRSHYLDALDDASNKPMAEMLDATQGDYENDRSFWEKITAQFAMEMCHLKDGRFRMSDSALTLAAAWEGVMRGPAKAGTLDTRAQGAECHCVAGPCRVPIAAILKQAVAMSQKMVVGFCLDCTKLRKKPWETCEHEGQA